MPVLPETDMATHGETPQAVTHQRALSAQEMAARQKDLDLRVHAALAGYVEFPIADNFDLVTKVMREYQTAWMAGRKRVQVL